MAVLSKLLPISWAAATWGPPALVFLNMPLAMFAVQAQQGHTNIPLTYAAVCSLLIAASLFLWLRVGTTVARGLALGGAGLPLAFVLALAEWRRNPADSRGAAHGPESYLTLFVAAVPAVGVGSALRPPLLGWVMVLALASMGLIASCGGVTRRIATGLFAAIIFAFLLKCSGATYSWLFSVTT